MADIPTIDLSGIAPKSATPKTLAWDGKKAILATNIKKSFANLTAPQLKELTDYAVYIGKKASDAKAIWGQLVDASTASYAQGVKSSPFDVLRTNRASIPAGTFSQAPTTYYANDYSDVAGPLVQAAFSKVFGRIPTAAELAAPSPIKDASGKALTWADALIQAANDPANQQTQSYETGADGKIRKVITKNGFNPSTWLETNMTSAYADAIKSGAATAEASITDKYNKLASEYGIKTIDPTTMQPTGTALIDLAALEAGTKTIDQIQKEWAGATLSKMPQLTPALNAGLSPAQVADSAMSTLATMTGKNKSLITVDNPFIQAYLKGDGKSTMSDKDFKSMIMSSPDSGFADSQYARNYYDNLAGNVLSRMGFNA